jgi:uncharacterized protein (TIGR02118 family)
MVKLVILFKRPADEAVFETRYRQSLALMAQLPGIRQQQVWGVLGNPAGKSPYFRVLELLFDDFAALDKALVSEEGRAAGADLMRFAGHDTELIFAEALEEQPGANLDT